MDVDKLHSLPSTVSTDVLGLQPEIAMCPRRPQLKHVTPTARREDAAETGEGTGGPGGYLQYYRRLRYGFLNLFCDSHFLF